jgi:uncharacterized protein (DUF305 family)
MNKHALLPMALAGSLMAAGVSQAQEQTEFQLPEACLASVGAGAAQPMDGAMPPDMEAQMGEMGETQQGLTQAMMQMTPLMMQGIMNPDADVAWVCAMIPHHQGAIAMAQAGLLEADNEESRRLAEQTIEENRASAQELIDWVNQNAAVESENEVENGQ